MNHLIRAGALIALLVIGFVLVRWAFIPESFGQYGFYRGENVAEWADWPMQYAPLTTCSTCHQQRYDTWANSKHSSVSCENCHGAAQNHAQTGAELVSDVAREICGVCHAQILARRSDFPQVDIEEHGAQALCITCHDPHNPQVPTGAMPPIITHSLEGRADCLLCHQVGGAGVGESGGMGMPADHEGRASESCLGCHELR